MPEQPDGLTLLHVERNYVIGGWSDENENDPQTYGGICNLSVPYPFRPFCPFRPFARAGLRGRTRQMRSGIVMTPILMNPTE